MHRHTDSDQDPRGEAARLRSQLRAVRAADEQHSAALQQIEQRFALAMRVANDGIWDWDFATDYVYFSPRWKGMLGYGDDELENHLRTWGQLVHPDDQERVLRQVREYLAGIRPTFEVEMRMRHRDGRYLDILSRASVVYRSGDGEPIRLVGTHVDITERKRAETFHRKHAEALEMIALGRPAPEIYDAIARMYQARHPGMRCSMLELQGNTLLHGGAPSLPMAYRDAVHGLKNGPNIGSCGTSTYTGRRVLVEDIATDPKWADLKQVALAHGLRCCWSEPIKNASGCVLGAFGMYYNEPGLPNAEQSADLQSAAHLAGIVMERDRTRRQIDELAYKDALTGLNSRAYLSRMLEEMIEMSERHGRRFSLLHIDLDDFKDINDGLGHDLGDELLKTIAERLTAVERSVDFVARLGGDEFCVLVDGVDDNYAAATAAQRCLDSISRPTELASKPLTPRCSIGIAHFPDDGRDVPSLIKAADTALYSAKELGKNRYAFYKPELTRKAEHRFQMEQYLRTAIERQELTLVYQPQIEVATGAMIGVEALSRWHHPVLGRVPPNEFVETAERMGMIRPLTASVLLSACRQAMAWKASGLPALRMSVNVSPSQFLDREILHLVEHAVAETGMDPAQLELEVTEGVVQTDRKNLAIFQALKDLGVQLAIDDFGKGYSSFASLKHLNVDHLKIDKYFFDDILADPKTLNLVASMIEMGHNLGHGIVAEGIEVAEQLERIRELGCETAQGYLFSRPLPSEEIPALLEPRASV